MTEQNQTRKEELVACVCRLAEELQKDMQAKLEGNDAWEESQKAKLLEVFKKCFINTVETTVSCLENGEIFLITGDIEAMWLRDSSCQVAHYLPFLKKEPLLAEMVRDLIFKQFEQIAIDPYANAFNSTPSGACWAKDRTKENPWVWERKYEIDSLCYPVWLLREYYEKTGDKSVFTPHIHEVLKTIVALWAVEQEHETASDYYFERDNCPPTDTLQREGRGTPVKKNGMIWCGFRPSDDACTYGYLVPSNFFAARTLAVIAKFADSIYGDSALKEQALTMRGQVLDGIRENAVVEDEVFGRIYAYETDGFGNHLCMDDANVPNLLSLPWLGCVDSDDPLYQSTRSFVLSERNPYYYKGKAAKGIGSPHTPEGYIWHIALSMQGLTAQEPEEKTQLLQKLLETDAGTGYMHEGFSSDDPAQFTRPWFAWSNSMFALFAEKFLLEV